MEHKSGYNIVTVTLLLLVFKLLTKVLCGYDGKLLQSSISLHIYETTVQIMYLRFLGTTDTNFALIVPLHLLYIIVVVLIICIWVLFGAIGVHNKICRWAYRACAELQILTWTLK